MSDLLTVLPSFQTSPFTHILPSLDRAGVTVVDLISLSPGEVGKRAQVPPGEVAKLVGKIVEGLREGNVRKKVAGLEEVGRIKFLDETIDEAVGGGVRTGALVEITGESGVGKTQFLLTLLLAVQLPPSKGGLGKSALYISTEAALSTARLSQLLHTHPVLSSLPDGEKPSLDRVLSIQTPDLESQEHILRYQVPVAIKRHNVGLIVIDSIAANFRAEFEALSTSSTTKTDATTPKNHPARKAQSMADRKPQLVQIGAILRNLARVYNIAVVVSNQIGDRFSPTTLPRPISQVTGTQNAMTPDPLTLDHQQRWFTGWGDLPAYTPGHGSLKTPSLGLVWANQLAGRIALIKEEGEAARRRRWLRVVFAGWTAATGGMGVEFEIEGGGVRAVRRA